MLIQTVENQSYSLDTVPDVVSGVFFTILDNSDPGNPDFNYVPLIFLESFTTPALVLRIGEHTLRMPLDWDIVIADPEAGNLEAMPMSAINDRDFHAFQYNSLSSFIPTFEPIEILDIYNEVTWHAPKLKTGQFVSTPLSETSDPPCVYFGKDTSKTCEIIRIGSLW